MKINTLFLCLVLKKYEGVNNWLTTQIEATINLIKNKYKSPRSFKI